MTIEPHIEVPRATQYAMQRMLSELLRKVQDNKPVADGMAELLVDEVVGSIGERPSVFGMTMFAHGLRFAGSLGMGVSVAGEDIVMTDIERRRIIDFGERLMLMAEMLSEIVGEHGGPKLDFNDYTTETAQARVRGPGDDDPVH